jgi:hypothetical protein
MIEFQMVTKEFRSLFSRRRELVTFLGSVFAALGIFLQNTLAGSLPLPLAGIEEHLFRYYAAMLMVPSLIHALRMARLHGGMVLNGMLYARLMQDQNFTTTGDPERAARHDLLGVSFLQFLLADFIAGFSAAVLSLMLTPRPALALAAGIGVSLAWLALYARFHRAAVQFARRKIAAESCAPFDRADWEAHVSASLKDANHGLIADVGFVGLMVFSVFEVMSGFGQIRTSHLPDLRGDDVRLFGPLAYTVLMLVTCAMGLITYLRLRVAIGKFSLDLDPTDYPFRPLALTDSFLGYLLLAFLMAVSVHLSLIQAAPGLGSRVVLGIDAATLVLAVLAEQATLVVAGRHFAQKPRGPAEDLGSPWDYPAATSDNPPPQPVPYDEPTESLVSPEGGPTWERPPRHLPEEITPSETGVEMNFMSTDPITQIAQRHGFSAQAAQVVLLALQSTGGGLAQFNHPELGGQGQWMPGMSMIGDMFNSSLKARVDALCAELSALVRSGGAIASTPVSSPAPAASPGVGAMRPMEPMKPMEPMRAPASWWPAELGHPSTLGGQNDMRYAYFPSKRRLAISEAGKVTLYDTADHQIDGVSQQQSGGGRSEVVFTSQHGKIPLAKLKVVRH